MKLYDREVCPNADSVLLRPLNNFLNKKVKLESARDSAVVVEQVLTAKHFKASNSVINCIFKIDARKHNKGLFAVIRRLNFRKTPYDTCRDYIRFTYSNDRDSEKICGNVTSSSLLGLKDGGGKLKIEINIDTRTPLDSVKDTIEFSLIFTGFGTCNQDRVPCFRDDNDTCISKYFYRDGYQNCPDPCLDEGGCDDIKMESLLEPSDIIISALTSLIFTMVVFGSCLWLCWKYRECHDVQRQDQIQRRPRPPAPNFEMHTSDSSTSPEHDVAANRSMPTAPPLSHAVAVEKEDMPPSYSDLFPER